MTDQSTLDKLFSMKFSAMARAVREQEEAKGISEMTFDERFSLLVDAEWDSRRANKRLRLLRQAGFPQTDAHIADVRYDADRKLDRAQLLDLARSEWVAEHRNVIVTGASGAGKSWISCALGVAACNAFFSVRYTRLPELLDEVCVAKDDLWLKAKRRFIKCDLLIIDDWLLEPVTSAEAREILEIVEARSRGGSLLLCSQFSPAGWHEMLGQGAIADAVVDRIIYNSHTIHIEGEESMRKRTSTL